MGEGNTVFLPGKISLSPEYIPAELKRLPHWVAWRWVRRKSENTAEIKHTKPPIQINGNFADVSKPETWIDFDSVYQAYLRRDDLHGIGIVLVEGDGIVSYDLDHCVDKVTGEIDPAYEWIVRQLDTYTEITPSGDGLRLFIHGDVPTDGRKTGGIECYKRSRFVTVTGNHYPGTPKSIEARDDSVWQQLWGAEDRAAKIAGKPSKPKKTAKNPAQAPAGAKQTDAEAAQYPAGLPKRGRALWRGTIDPYPSQSEADLSLCRLLVDCTGGDGEAADRLFRESGLYRPKWDEAHASDGTTYGQSTMAIAVDLHKKAHRYTDMGNAARLTQLIEGEVKYIGGKWYVWVGTHWEEDRLQRIYLYTKRVVQQLFDDAAEEKDAEFKAKIIAHAYALENRGKVEAMLKFTEAQPSIAARQDMVDLDRDSFNVLNGTITGGYLREHNSEDLITRVAPVAYDPLAEAPSWNKFLSEVCIDQAMVEYLQRVAGYTLTGHVHEETLFFFYGTGQNGKSTFVDTLMYLFGAYAKQLMTETLMITRGQQHPTGLADLQGVRLAAASELNAGQRFNEEVIKQITGNAKITARKMYQDSFDFDSTAKLWIQGNHKPDVRGTDFAIWRRIHLIPFTTTIPMEKRDSTLKERLKNDEASGILNWCVKGWRMWQQDGLQAPASVVNATQEYRRESDALQEFIEEELVQLATARAVNSEVYARYRRYMEDRREFVLTLRQFTARMKEKGLVGKTGAHNVMYWHGVKLNERGNAQGDL